MSTSDDILRLTREAKALMRQQKYHEAKNTFLDAASLAVMESKNNSPEAERFKKIAQSLIALAKEAQEEQDLTKLSTELPDIPGTSASFTPRIARKKDPEKSFKIFHNLNFPDPMEQISIPLGKSYETGETIYWEPGQEMNGLIMTTGGSGSGKTEFLRSMVKELTERGYPCLILDLHGDIDTGIPSISLDYRGEYGINPLTLNSTSEIDGGPFAQINLLMSQFDDAIDDRFSSTQKNWLREILKFAYYAHGLRQEDATTWGQQEPDFEYLYQLMRNPESVIKKSQYGEFGQIILSSSSSTRTAVMNRLQPFLEHPAFTGQQLIPLHLCTKYPLRIELKPLQTTEMQSLAANVILNQLFSIIKGMDHITEQEDSKKFRLFVVIDEVKILSGSRGDLSDPNHILNRLASEARKFGMGLILASQVIRHFGKDIRSNSATKLILRPMDADEAKLNAKEAEVSADQLLDLELPGEGYLMTTSRSASEKMRLFSYESRMETPDTEQE